MAQFINTISSPAVAEVIGPVNAVSKLGNALGDVILGRRSTFLTRGRSTLIQ